MEQQTGSKNEKEHVKTVYCHPAFNLYAEYIMRNAGLEEAQAGIKIAGRNINTLRYADDTTLMAGKQRRTKEPHDESERGVKKLAESSTFRKLRSWHPVPSLHGN